MARPQGVHKDILASLKWAPHHTCTSLGMALRDLARGCLHTAMATLVATHSVPAILHTRVIHHKATVPALGAPDNTQVILHRDRVATHPRAGGLMDLIWVASLVGLLPVALKVIPSTLA